jgi:1-acyl-sn-glycerol-3-phosphate acyltransferase
MRAVVAEGGVLGMFAEGTRQRSGVPGPVQPGAAMVALQEDVPVTPVAVHGTQYWTPRNRSPCSVAYGAPISFDGLPRGGRGYREASDRIEQEIRRLWEWLVEIHAQGRPRGLTPP